MQKSRWRQDFDDYLNWILNWKELEAPVWVVGVSGGADSLALVYLMQEWAEPRGIRIIALTVNHGLRKEADAEAEYVAALMKKLGIEQHILYWEGQKPVCGIEEAARQARYDLMRKWCVERGYPNLFIAHHKQDQAETFLMRLQRGSGVDGLAAMAEVSRWCGINIIRPLLRVDPEDLRDYLNQKSISWVEDESNQCDDFLRVKVRKLLPQLELNIGLGRERLCNTALEMARVRDYLEKQTQSFVDAETTNWYDMGFSLAQNSLLQLHEEMGLRVLRTLLKKIGGRSYPPRMEEVERLWEAVKNQKFAGCTLAGCEILLFRNSIWIIAELREKNKLSKLEWEEFVGKNPNLNLEKVTLPYKFKRLLWNNG